MSDQRIVVKVVLCGGSGVDKTFLRRNFMGESFIQDHLDTLGADFSVNHIKLESGEIIEFQIWDLAEQTGFENLRQRFFKNSLAAIMVFDLDRHQTLKELNSWFNGLWSSNGDKSIPIVILGIIGDPNNILVSEDEVNEFITDLIQENNIQDNHIRYFTTSIETGENIDLCFDILAKSIYEQYKQDPLQFLP